MTAAAPIDCLRFAGETLELQGALVEHTEGASFAVCPADVADRFGIPEDAELTSGEERSGAVPVGFGTPLLERLVERAKEETPIVHVAADIEPPRPAQAKRLAERITVRNGVFEVLEVLGGKSVYSFTWLAWTADCDDRYDGIVHGALAEEDLAEAEPVLFDLLTPTRDNYRLGEGKPLPSSYDTERIAASVRVRAAAAAQEELCSIRASLMRRKQRDHERIVQYFADLARDAVAGQRRARVDSAALAEKLEHFAAERDAKLSDLDARFALRVSLRPAALLRVELPVVRARVRVRRRKSAREVMFRLPAGATQLDRPACEACLIPLTQPALCDDALHLLCETCAPDARGRIACGACGKE